MPVGTAAGGAELQDPHWAHPIGAATEVAAGRDGAEWVQGGVDYACSDARRILDQPYAVEHLHAVAEVF